MENVEESIKKLEGNQLKIAKEFSKQGVVFYLTLAGMKIASLGEEKYKAYVNYMRDSIDKANKQIGDAKDVGKGHGISQ